MPRRPLRVCMVTGYLPTPGGGGMEKHVYELVRGLLRRGVEVDVVCEERSFLPDPEHDLADHIIGTPPRSFPPRDWVAYYRAKSRELAGMVDVESYDVIHCHNHYGSDVAQRLEGHRDQPAHVTTFHLTPEGALERYRRLGMREPEGAPIDREVAGMERVCAALSDHCIAVSTPVAREIERFYQVPRDRVSVIHNWYDPAIFHPIDRLRARQELGLDPDGRLLLYVGHFELQRGKLMADALRLLPDSIRMVVIHPDHDPSIEAEFGERITFAGYVPHRRMPLYYSAADLQCFPTVYAGFGLVLLEGMACGCPPVAFDFEPMSEIVTSASGYLVSDTSPEAYASAIQDAFRDCPEMRRAAANRATAFDLNQQIDKVLALYRQVLGRRPSPALLNPELHTSPDSPGPPEGPQSTEPVSAKRS